MVGVMVVAAVLVVVGEGKVVGWLVVEAWLWLWFRMW